MLYWTRTPVPPKIKNMAYARRPAPARYALDLYALDLTPLRYKSGYETSHGTKQVRVLNKSGY